MHFVELVGFKGTPKGQPPVLGPRRYYKGHINSWGAENPDLVMLAWEWVIISPRQPCIARLPRASGYLPAPKRWASQGTSCAQEVAAASDYKEMRRKIRVNSNSQAEQAEG